jgi:deazaflavin-dependent oxidoreductase (nitroreductase family)
MATSRMKRGFLWVLKNTLNRATLRAARSGRGPFSLVRHVGRKTGKTYETPLLLAQTGAGFVAELTYGTDVSWYRNIVAAGQCVIVHHGIEHHIDRIEPCSAPDGLRAFGYPRSLILRLLRRKEFRLLHETRADAPPGRPRSVAGRPSRQES